MISELIPELILELIGDQAEIGDPDSCPLTSPPLRVLRPQSTGILEVDGLKG